MTKEELLEKYGREFFFFHRCYKYVFSYRLALDSKDIYITFGGDPAEFYRTELSNGMTLNDINNLFDEWDFDIVEDY